MFINKNSIRTLLLTGCASFAIALAAHAQSAKPVQFDIPAGDLAGAVNAIAVQGQQETAVDAALLRGKRAPAIRASLTPRDALQRLLADTGLQVRQAGNGGLVVEAAGPPAAAAQSGAASPVALEEVIVTAEEG